MHLKASENLILHKKIKASTSAECLSFTNQKANVSKKAIPTSEAPTTTIRALIVT